MVQIIHGVMDEHSRLKADAAAGQPSGGSGGNGGAFVCFRNGVRCASNADASGESAAAAATVVATAAEAPDFACQPEWPLNGEAAKEEWEHIVWLGDSLTRYEYLQLARPSIIHLVRSVDRAPRRSPGDY